MKTAFLFITCLAFLIPLKAQMIFQAEDADIIYQGAIETEHTGYTGTGYVNSDNKTGPYIEWAVSMASAGEQSITFFYANGATDDRSMKLTINGTEVENISFTGTGAWTTYDNKSINAAFSEGLNLVRMTSTSSSGGPNLDKIEITGEPGAAFFPLTVNIHGEGSVTMEPAQDYFEYGSVVKLTASPADTFFLAGWKGDLQSSDTTIQLTIDSSNYISAMFMRYNIIAKTNEVIGWCNYNTPITGGAGGEEITVTNQSELSSALSSSSAKVIFIENEITLTPKGTELTVGSNKSVIGVGPNAIISGGGLKPQDASNIIIKNLTFKDAYVSWDGKATDNDALEVNNAQHVLITHCDFSHFDDGLIDIKNGSDYVTVSWCHFHNHNKVMLIGSADDSPQDVGKLNVTIHHNWFDGSADNGIGQRLPMGRYGMIHVFNNYYNDVITRGAEANFDANMVVDNNYFLNTEMPHVKVGGAGANKINASGNIYVNSGSRRDHTGTAFTPSDYYEYTYNDAENVPILVMLGSGVEADTLIGRVDSAFIATSIETEIQRTQNKVDVYPNPARESFTISFHSTTRENVHLEIISSTGTLLSRKEWNNVNSGMNSISVETKHLTPGIYLVQLQQGDSHVNKKLIIE